MKTKYLIPAVAITLTSCQKDEEVVNDIEQPITRQIYADFTTADTSALRVSISRATQDHVPMAWKNVDGHLFVLVTQTGNQGNVYRNDHIYFFSNATSATTIPVRLDDVQTFNVTIDPAQNGQVVYQTVTDW